MKIMAYYPWIIGCLLLVFAEREVVGEDLATSSAGPSPGAIIIVSRGRDWSIEQLHKTGLEFLKANASLPKESKVRAIVHVFPDDKVTMCEILYVQDFGQPYWRVKIGYDGKVSSYEKRVKREG